MASLDKIIFLFTHVCISNAYWQSDKNITILCIYLIVISDTQICSWMCFLLAHCIIIRASWETKKKRLSYRKKYIEEFVWETSLFWLHTLVIFCRFFFFLSTPFPYPSDVLAEWQFWIHSNFVEICCTCWVHSNFVCCRK